METSRKTTPRQSNIELLRIVAMLFVLILHADYMALKAPTLAEITGAPFQSALPIFAETASIVAVNVFVMISGWFGLRATVRGGVLNYCFRALYSQYSPLSASSPSRS